MSSALVVNHLVFSGDGYLGFRRVSGATLGLGADLLSTCPHTRET